MELTALIMDDVTKKVKQFSLPVELEYVASEFGFYVGDVSIEEGGSFVDKGYFVSR